MSSRLGQNDTFWTRDTLTGDWGGSFIVTIDCTNRIASHRGFLYFPQVLPASNIP